MLTASYYTMDGQQVGEPIDCNTDDLEFATLQAMAVTGFELLLMATQFSVIGSDNKRMVIGEQQCN